MAPPLPHLPALAPSPPATYRLAPVQSSERYNNGRRSSTLNAAALSSSRSSVSSSKAKTYPNRPRGHRGRFISLAEPNRKCADCGQTATSQWRSGSNGESLCNACGIRATRKSGHGSRSHRGVKTERTKSSLSLAPLKSGGQHLQNNESLPSFGTLQSFTKRRKCDSSKKSSNIHDILN